MTKRILVFTATLLALAACSSRTPTEPSDARPSVPIAGGPRTEDLPVPPRPDESNDDDISLPKP